MHELLVYMKEVVEGRDSLQPFARWLHENDVELQEFCSRGSYLRLKSNPIPEFRGLLREYSVDFEASEHAYLPSGPADFSWIRPEWLTTRLFPYRQSPTRLARETGFLIDEWLHLIHIKESDDELWRFRTPESSCAKNAGSSGIALVRGHRVVYAVELLGN